ncbi:helix-turn-helix transcriptional regulator [Cupriavidus sp. GA3-3]|uniref:helix-turn-helix domain-containing protein n=1 Tax=Cupriavidus sp. GA3-3 TaxID=1229514 RepID=UPI001FEDEF42|nr:helix-turn-helix transcriptional regulator [Cupriavidus sp. GA3-3]
MPIDQAARHCGVAVGMLSRLENGKGVKLEHALRVLDGLGLTMLVVPKAHALGSKRLRPMRPRLALLKLTGPPRWAGIDVKPNQRGAHWPPIPHAADVKHAGLNRRDEPIRTGRRSCRAGCRSATNGGVA